MQNRWTALALTLAPFLIASSAAAQEATEDSTTKIVGKMQVAVGQLKKLDTGQPTQTTQKQIVENLDELIARLEQECENCRGAKRPNPTKPMSDSMIRKGPGGMGNLHAAQKEGKDWGELPAHERDRILQSMTEGFPAHYQRILERYYKRLAQETPVSADGAATESAATDEPAKDRPATDKPADTQPPGAVDAKPPAAGNEK